MSLACEGCVPAALSRAWASGGRYLTDLAPAPINWEPEGQTAPAGLAVFDAHVHLFPERLNLALWDWFERHAWGIRYRLHAEEAADFLLSRGIRRVTALLYAHRPGMAASLNRFAAELGRANPGVLPLGTVFPGEPDAEEVVREALGPLGLRGLKLHCHVQRFAPDDPRLWPVYREAQAAGRPVIIHAGREPSTPAYGVDTRALCAAERLERVLQAFPRLSLVVPHLGADEFLAYGALLDRYPNLWLDTTMAVAELLQTTFGADLEPAWDLVARAPRRLIYGSDFPNLPFAWDLELRTLLGLVPDADDRAALLWGNAAALFGD